MSKEGYEKIYSKHKNAFGTQPTAIAKEAVEYLNSGNALDLGAGQGRNSLFLAEKGFKVTAIDNAKTAIENLNKSADEKGLKLDTAVDDVSKVEFPENQDFVLASCILHHFTREEALQTIKKMQNSTNEGGLNVFNVITKDGDFYRNNPNTDKFYIDPGELQSLYQDWEILQSARRRWEAFQKRTDGSPMFNVSEEMIARKSKA